MGERAEKPCEPSEAEWCGYTGLGILIGFTHTINVLDMRRQRRCCVDTSITEKGPA